MWMAAGEWDKVGARLKDPRYDRHVTAPTRLRYALHARDWRGALRWFFPANVSHATASVYALAGLAALLWFWFCARIGQLGERPKLRLPLYVGAVLLGVASVFLTVAFIFVEEEFLHFREKKNAIADVIYFTLGVGLREELSKLVFFAPLIPIIRKFKGGKREVLACGALVGLGFAAEENVSYFGNGSLSVALVRFLTANFFHMSTAAISAMALDDFVRDREAHAQTLSRALFTVIAIHGLYDFFISNHDVAKWSFLSMVSLVLLARQFLSLVRGLRGDRGGRAHGVPLLTRFVISLAVLTGASFVYATFIAGPTLAARAMAEGLLGEAIIVYFFVQELQTMER
jgi:protease PrsW